MRYDPYPDTDRRRVRIAASVAGLSGGGPKLARIRRFFKRYRNRVARRTPPDLLPVYRKFSGWID